MKKIILGLGILIAVCFSFNSIRIDSTLERIVKKDVFGGKIKLINDTKEKVKVHTGTGSSSLNPNGGSTSFSCNTGKKVKVNGKVLFTNNDTFCGKTVKISEFL